MDPTRQVIRNLLRNAGVPDRIVEEVGSSPRRAAAALVDQAEKDFAETVEASLYRHMQPGFKGVWGPRLGWVTWPVTNWLNGSPHHEDIVDEHFPEERYDIAVSIIPNAGDNLQSHQKWRADVRIEWGVKSLWDEKIREAVEFINVINPESELTVESAVDSWRGTIQQYLDEYPRQVQESLDSQALRQFKNITNKMDRLRHSQAYRDYHEHGDELWDFTKRRRKAAQGAEERWTDLSDQAIALYDQAGPETRKAMEAIDLSYEPHPLYIVVS